MSNAHKRQKSLLSFFVKPVQQTAIQLPAQETKQCSLPSSLDTKELALPAVADGDGFSHDIHSGATKTNVAALQSAVQEQPAAEQPLPGEEHDRMQPVHSCRAETATDASASPSAMTFEMQAPLTNGSSVLSSAFASTMEPNSYEQEVRF